MTLVLRRDFWLNLAGASLLAIVMTVPVLMTAAMNRGFEIAKFSVALPLAILACGCALIAGAGNGLSRVDLATRTAAFAFSGFLLLATLSSILSEFPQVAFFGGYYRREGLLAWYVYGMFFVAVFACTGTSDRMHELVNGLLVGSLVPITYALMQRFDLDFYLVRNRDLTRVHGTLGNPNFLAGYLGLLLPLALVRCWQAREHLGAMALWFFLVLAQVLTMVSTQSRGPLLAGFGGLIVFFLCIAGRARNRASFAAVAAVVPLAVTAIVAINTIPAAQKWAQTTPIATRLVFSLDRNAGEATEAASRSVATRLGVWDAGAKSFAAAPVSRQLLGYGPDLAYMHYFSHMPASVMRTEGFGAANTFDRLHAEALDISLNFGLLGWICYALFFGVVIFAGTRGMFARAGRGSAWIFLALSLWGGVFGSVVAVQVGLASAAVPGFGLGIGVGWALFVCVCAWRATRSDKGASRAPAPRFLLLAAMTVAVLVFWMDAQVNIPVLTTRLIVLGLSALILLLAAPERELLHNDKAIGSPDLLWTYWCLAFGLVAGCASFFPVFVLESGSPFVDSGRWWLALVPLSPLLCLAVVAILRPAGPRRTRWIGLAVVAGFPLSYYMVHMMIRVHIQSGFDASHAPRIALATGFAPAFIFCMCVVYAIQRSLATSPVDHLLTGSAVLMRGGALAAAVATSAAACWQAIDADVASTAAQWTVQKQPQLSAHLVQQAIQAMPFERHYRRQLLFDALGRAIAEVGKSGGPPPEQSPFLSELAIAETQARAALAQHPSDPWAVLALANVLQLRGLRMLAGADAGASSQVAGEADDLFARAHQMFPAQPLLLRNWAQLKFDGGKLDAAYLLLDRMETLIPNDAEPYEERIFMARRAGDERTVRETLDRAARFLDANSVERLRTVATTQQNAR